jgi:hypothetical protein
MAETKASDVKSAKTKPATAKEGAPEAGAPVASLRGTCTVEKCGRALRAKGYCRKHFLAWRRGVLGVHHHYKICTKEACRKPRARGGLCSEHAAPPKAAAA